MCCSLLTWPVWCWFCLGSEFDLDDCVLDGFCSDLDPLMEALMAFLCDGLTQFAGVWGGSVGHPIKPSLLDVFCCRMCVVDAAARHRLDSLQSPALQEDGFCPSIRSDPPSGLTFD